MPRHKSTNALLLLRQRELSVGKLPQQCGRALHPNKQLKEWAEADLLRHCSSMYCNARPPPRSTIATAFSPDGRLLASTHGDHTVKVTCCCTGVCLKVLADHQRTPWVVRFHPHDSRILASGSLDSYVRVWDVKTGKCIYWHQFGRPIASIAFHAEGNELAVASGHRLYIWKYNQEGLTKPVPVVVLKTRRSLRAVHFHPQGAPLVLSAEVVAGTSSRRSALPVESTGLENRAERRARTERHIATNETIAALEVRLRQRLLDRDLSQPVPRPSADTASAAARGRLEDAAQSEARQQSAGRNRVPDTHRMAIDVDTSQRPGISLSVDGPHAAVQAYDTSMGTPSIATDFGRTETVRGIRAAPMETTSRPYISLTMSGTSFEPYETLSRHSMPARPSAQPVDIPPRTRVTPFTEIPLPEVFREGQQDEDFGMQEEDLNPSIRPSVRASARERHQSAGPHAGSTSEPQRSTAIPFPGTPRVETEPQRCRSLGAETAAEPSNSCPQHAVERWEAFSAERLASRRGNRPSAMSQEHQDAQDSTSTGLALDPAEDRRRRRHVLDILSLRRSSVPASQESTLMSVMMRNDRFLRESRESVPPELPRIVLERISNSGNNNEDAEAAGPPPTIPDLPQVIEGHWSGARRGEERPPTPHPAQRSPPAVQHSSRQYTGGLPPSLVNIGWEIPASSIIPDQPNPSTLIPNASRANSAPSTAPPGHPPPPQGRLATTAEVRSMAANVIGTEQPCHVMVRLWRYDHRQPAELGALQLAIHDTVLCSEMGAHFSPCGKMLAVCALAEGISDPGLDTDDGDRGRVYELRIYSLEACTFGSVLRSRPIKAAHCLTSIQFSPCSQHIMLAYGRRHISLLRSLIADNMTSIIPVHTVLEVYRVSDMSIVRVLPSADDEVNTAGFHPFEGGGLAYGTKEGRLRILTHSSYPMKTGYRHTFNDSWSRLEDELLAAVNEAGLDSSDDD